MRYGLKSDRIFRDFWKKGVPWRVIIPFLLGVLLLIIPLLFGERENESSEPSNDESCIEEICSAINGVEECRAVVTYSSDGSDIAAVAVIYTGSGSKETEKNIKDVISTLYGVGANRIAVISRKNN